MSKKIFIVDDHQLVIDALITPLNDHTDQFKLVGTASNGEEALDYLNLHSVDIVILDISMPKLDGTEVLKVMKKKYPRVKVLVLTMFSDLKHITEMSKNGAKGYILKNKGAQQVIEALTVISDGGEFFPPEITNVAFQALREGDELTYKSAKKMLVQSITDSEAELLRLLASDLMAKEIAEIVSVSQKTIEKRKKNLYLKLDIKSEKGLVRFAVENGFT